MVSLNVFGGGSVVRVEHLMPALVAQLCCSFCGTNDVSEKNGGEHAIVLRLDANTGQKALDLFQERVLITGVEGVIGTGKVDELSALDVIGYVAAGRTPHEGGIGSMKDQSWDLDCRKRRADIPFHSVAKHSFD